MKLIEPSFEIIDISGDLTTIEQAARTCYKSEDKIKDGSAERLVGTLVDRGHHAMLEFVDVTVKFITDRGIANEIVRHRIASYAQESTRYVNLGGKDMEFILPLSIKESEDPLPIQVFKKVCRNTEMHYNYYVKYTDLKPQDARAILPLCLKTELKMKTNLRSWLNFFSLRTAPAAHPEMRRITIPLCKEFQKRIPIVFDDFKL